eukprot:TRINITY_DN2101_c0_g1_i3.p1 TRINITY_DN2101_c0_g1~~TRINITY_DN2101_c0_g1_i3.p1  ORF type:complete len:766 (+),score=148.95 TRINITY_DN2101_c0_g1_i3:39-2336(+)
MATLCNIRCKVLYDFAGDLAQGQLPLQKGTTVTVTEKYDNGWWFADFKGEQGFIPADFVQEELAPVVKPLPSVPPQAAQPQPQPHPHKQSQPAQQHNHPAQQQQQQQQPQQFALPGIGAAALASLKHHSPDKSVAVSPRNIIDKQGSPSLSPRSQVVDAKPKVLVKAGSVAASVTASVGKQNKPVPPVKRQSSEFQAQKISVGKQDPQPKAQPQPQPQSQSQPKAQPKAQPQPQPQSQPQPQPQPHPQIQSESDSAQPVLFKAKALYEFPGDLAQEQIPLQAGEVIDVIETFDNGWWFGENSQKQQGFFPTNFVEKLPALPAKPAKIVPPLKPKAGKTAPPKSSGGEHSTGSNDETRAAIIIQKHIRRHLQRTKYLKARRGVVHFQALYRGHRVRKHRQHKPEIDNSNAMSRLPTSASVPLSHTTKGRPAGRGGRRPPTRGHKVESVQEQPRERLNPQILAVAGGFGTSTDSDSKPTGGSAIVLSGPSLAPGFDPTKVNLRKTDGPQKLAVSDDSAIDFRKQLHMKKTGQSTENMFTPSGRPLAAHGTVNAAMLRQETQPMMSMDNEFHVDGSVRTGRSTTVVGGEGLRPPIKDLPAVPPSNIFTDAANKTPASSEWKNKRFAVGKVLTSFFKSRPKKEDLIEKKILVDGTPSPAPTSNAPPSTIIADPFVPTSPSPGNSGVYSMSSSPTNVSGIYQQSSGKDLDPFCNSCRKAFGLLTSKHHCRSCNKSFCSKCAKKKIALPQSADKKPVRVCDSCFQTIWNSK